MRCGVGSRIEVTIDAALLAKGNVDVEHRGRGRFYSIV